VAPVPIDESSDLAPMNDQSAMAKRHIIHRLFMSESELHIENKSVKEPQIT
jgi:hypothetical protein